MKSSHKHRYRLCLEQLEDRLVPAAYYWAGVPGPLVASWEYPDWVDSNHNALASFPKAGDTAIFDSAYSNYDCAIVGKSESCGLMAVVNSYTGTLHIEALGTNNGSLTVIGAFTFNSSGGSISLERGSATGSVGLNLAGTSEWDAGTFKGDNYSNDTVYTYQSGGSIYVRGSGPWIINDVGTDASGGVTFIVNSGLYMQNSTGSVLVNGTGTTYLDIKGTMEFVHDNTYDGKGGITDNTTTGTSWINVESSGSVIADAGLSSSPVCGIPAISNGTITVHCGQNATGGATGGLMFSGMNAHTNGYSLYINGGTVTLDNDPTLSGQALWAVNSMYMNGGTFNAAPAGGTAYLNGGTFTFTLNGGTLNVGATDGSSYGILSISGGFTLSGGTINLWISGDGSFWDRVLATGTGLITGGTLSLTLNGAYQSWMQPANRVLLSAQGGWGSTNWASLSFSCGTGNIHWGHNATTVYAYPNPP